MYVDLHTMYVYIYQDLVHGLGRVLLNVLEPFFDVSVCWVKFRVRL